MFNKKAISPLIAVVLLILVVAIGGIAIYKWYKAQAGVIGERAGGVISEIAGGAGFLEITGMYTDGGNIYVKVRNTGNSKVTSVKMEVNGKSDPEAVVDEIPPKREASIKLSLLDISDVRVGDTIDVKVTSSEGITARRVFSVKVANPEVLTTWWDTSWTFRLPFEVSAKQELDRYTLSVDVNLKDFMETPPVNPEDVVVRVFDTSGKEYPAKWYPSQSYSETDPVGTVAIFVDKLGIEKKFYIYIGLKKEIPKFEVVPRKATRFIAVEYNHGGIGCIEFVGTVFSVAGEVDDVDGTINNHRNRGIVVGDFDNDGLLDIVAANGDSDDSGGDIKFHFLKGEGGCKFAPKELIATVSGGYTGVWAMDMASGDFNRDGSLDFVGAGDWAGGRFWVFGGNGDGTFTQTHYGTTGGGRRGMDAADFDNDGCLDIITARCCDGHVYFIKGNCDGTFAAPQFVANIEDEEYGGDGDTNPGADAVILYDTSGEGGCWGEGGDCDDPYLVIAGDFDNDGCADVVVDDRWGRDIWFLKGKCDGTFYEGNYIGQIYPAASWKAGDAYDFDEDGNLDLIIIDYNRERLLLCKGNGDGTFQECEVVATDFDESGGFSEDWALGIAAPEKLLVNIEKGNPEILKYIFE